MATVRISINEISDLACKALIKNGISDGDAKIILDHLLQSELAGYGSHGFLRIPEIVRAAKKVGTPGEIIIEAESPFSALLNGSNRQGLVVALKATEIAINKVKRNKFALIGGHSYVGTTGTLGYYTRKIANNNLIGIMIAGSAEGVSPWGGAEMILGTNPISISIPRDGDPVVVDMATAAISYGNLSLAMMDGRKIPEGVVLDKDGNPSTDPHDADHGSQLPMAGHKGYGLGLAVEILAGPLVGAKAGVKAVPGSDGFTILAIAPEIFVSTDQFKSQVSSLITEIKESRKRPGVTEIFYPGEKSQNRRLKNSQLEYIEMIDKVVESIRDLVSN